MADIILINPRFEVSFWGLEHAIRFAGKRANMPVACLPLLAALTPPGHTVTLVDENVEAIDFERCGRADIVGVTGMSVQRFRMREILAELKRRGAFTVIGGPWITACENGFEGLADVIFIGEAEETWPRFLGEWQEGRHQLRYEQAEKSDMAQVPVPRFDLLKMRHYACGSVQFSRGCPFTCEFCDIIVMFGRRPRLKTSAQILAELEALRAQGMRLVFIVDDNLIGNKKAIKAVLHDVITWQEASGYPLSFFTEASLDLAEDEELMTLMVEAGIEAVFVGIESPNESALRETGKLQNIRKGASLVERVHAIQRAGMEVWSGMIVGFDHDDMGIFDAQRQFLKEARIANAMIGMLTAIPKTPLHARLAEAGRLDPADPPSCGTNVIPLRMSRKDLCDGYVKLMADVYAADSYFERLDRLYLDERLVTAHGRAPYWRDHPWRRLQVNALFLAEAVAAYLRLMHGIPEAELRREYRQRLWRVFKTRPKPSVLRTYAIRCAMHYHFQTLVRRMTGEAGTVINAF
jgi:radical SAM superfamily enzyme YgiQ (UPF0313 family)